MAGDWIKLETCLFDKPEVMRLARRLKVNRWSVVGALVLFWVWLDKHSVDGSVDGVVDADVDAVVEHQGFAEALESVGWLKIDRENERIEAPNFANHNGETAKKRALKNARQARWRASTHASTKASTREEVKKKKEKIEFDGAGWKNISDQQRALWSSAYPAVNLDRELAAAAAWIVANPQNTKSNWARFLNGWLNRGQDKAPRVATPKQTLARMGIV